MGNIKKKGKKIMKTKKKKKKVGVVSIAG